MKLFRLEFLVRSPRLAAVSIAALSTVMVTTLLMLTRIDPETPYTLGAALGHAVEAVAETGRLEITNGERSWFATKMPFVPYLYGALWSLTGSVWAMVLIKNFLFGALLLAALFMFCRHFRIADARLLVCVALLFWIPFNAMTAMTLSYEEAVLAYLLPVAFALVLASPALPSLIALSVLVAMIYLTKSSTILVCAWLSVAVLLTAARVPVALRLLPTIALAASVLTWGAHIENKTGRFAFGSSASSNNGWNFYKGNNKLFAETYPNQHLDTLSATLRSGRPEFVDEWGPHDYYLGLGRAFVDEDPDQALANALQKLRFALFSIQDFDFNRNRVVKIVAHNSGMIVNRIVLLSALGIATVWVVLGLWRREPARAVFGLVYLGTVAAFLLPFVVGFAYQRHMVPLFQTSVFFVALAGQVRWQDVSIWRETGTFAGRGARAII